MTKKKKNEISNQSKKEDTCQKTKTKTKTKTKINQIKKNTNKKKKKKIINQNERKKGKIIIPQTTTNLCKHLHHEQDETLAVL